jgi:AraC family ethanolamine operon transcriptional activator
MNAGANADRSRVVEARFKDLDELTAAVQGTDAAVLRRGRGPLDGGALTVQLDSVTLQWMWHSAPLIGWATTIPGHWEFLVPTRTGQQGTANGHPLDSNSLVCYRPGSEMHGAAPEGGCVAINLIVATDALARASEAIGANQICPAPRLCTLLRPAPGLLAALRSAANAVHAVAIATPEMFENAELRRTFGDEVLGALVAAIHSDSGSGEGREWASEFHARLAGRAGALLRRSDDEHVSIARLSDATGESERQLERAFRATFGVSPMRYARLWKLHRVREALHAHVEATTVGAAALDLGFSDLGRFAADYRMVFGESPSETLRRVRSSAGTWGAPGAGRRVSGSRASAILRARRGTTRTGRP